MIYGKAGSVTLTPCILFVAAAADAGTSMLMRSALAIPLTEERAIGNPVYESKEYSIKTSLL